MRLEQYQLQSDELLATTDLELGKITTVLDRVKSPAISAYKSIRSYSMDVDVTSMITEEFEEAGWSVCRCRGETDHCIGRVTVVSTDSDYLFSGATVLLREDPKDHAKYRAYVMEDVLRSLGLTAAAWRVLAIVSGNDYSKNLDKVGIITNYSTLVTIDVLPDMNSTQIRLYCASHANDEDEIYAVMARFQVAQDVFINNNKETLSNDTSTRRIAFELERGRLQRVLGDVSMALQR
ncbi:hypothetical protein BGX28_005849 [Mortierella sp. GBA30]|nr:hypothetical protein BGX28_005849 [Mortierella sp. GBA30]